MNILKGSTTQYDLDITFFVPCYNEEGNIEATLSTITAAMAGFSLRYEILIIDDASKDRTVDVVEKIMKENPVLPIRLIRNAVNRGLGYNYFRGAFLARGTHYMIINGDNVEPVETIQKIIAHCGHFDMIIPYFGKNDTRSFVRRTISQVFLVLVNILSGNKLHYYNGPVLHNTDNVRFFRSETQGYGYQAELLCRLLHEGTSYVEVIVPNAEREWGTSKAFSLGNILSVSNSLFHIFWRRLEYFSFRVLKPSHD